MIRIAFRSMLTLGLLIAAALGGPASAADISRTSKVIVRPVTAAGTPVPGYTVTTDSGFADCRGRAAWAVSRGIDWCTPSAAYLPSCWHSTPHSVLCLRDVTAKALVRIRYEGHFVVEPPRRSGTRSPQRLRLERGGRCRARIGGAWGSPPGHPDWFGWYSCTNGSVYGTDESEGIDRSTKVWTVHLVTNDGRVLTRKVLEATYVGTAS